MGQFIEEVGDLTPAELDVSDASWILRKGTALAHEVLLARIHELEERDLTIKRHLRSWVDARRPGTPVGDAITAEAMLLTLAKELLAERGR